VITFTQHQDVRSTQVPAENPLGFVEVWLFEERRSSYVAAFVTREPETSHSVMAAVTDATNDRGSTS
jgi:hypothetical protein